MGGRQSSSTTDSATVSPQRRSARPRHEFLTEAELTAARTTWVRLQATRNMQSMGVKIFLRIFELEPATKQAFESFRDLSHDELVTNVLFRSHATRFMKAVEVTMNNLDALDVIIVPNLKHLGRLHTDFKGFYIEYLKAFDVAMEEVWEDELGRSVFTGDCRLAWTKIFALITSKVMEGYNEAKAEAAATPTKSSSVKDGGSGGPRRPVPSPTNENEVPTRQTTNGDLSPPSTYDIGNN